MSTGHKNSEKIRKSEELRYFKNSDKKLENFSR
jgi:hypothetical protein